MKNGDKVILLEDIYNDFADAGNPNPELLGKKGEIVYIQDMTSGGEIYPIEVVKENDEAYSSFFVKESEIKVI